MTGKITIIEPHSYYRTTSPKPLTPTRPIDRNIIQEDNICQNEARRNTLKN